MNPSFNSEGRKNTHKHTSSIVEKLRPLQDEYNKTWILIKQEMENPKYYVPTIEEFHVGFEYELFAPAQIQKHGSTVNIKVFQPKVLEKLSTATVFNLEMDLKETKVRVKYLDKEDIESLEFTELGPNGWINAEGWRIKKLNDNLYDILDYRNKLPHESPVGYLRFSGIIKNKSELKRILKQLKHEL